MATSMFHARRKRLLILSAPLIPLLAGALIAASTLTSQAATPAGASGSWITFANGKLTYGTDSNGNRIPDYSYAGYGLGAVPLPTIATKVTVGAPSGGDDTAAVQAAINHAAALPLDASGFRGAVQLAKGTYHIAGSLSITASGVVLRGADGTAADTTLVATGASARTLITVGGSSSYSVVGAQAQVTDTYLPVGGTKLTLNSATGFKAGDQIVVERPTTQAWINALGMTNLWSPNWSLRSERTITAVTGNQITLDVPLTTALEKQYTQALVYHYTFPRIDHVGLENFTADGNAMTADPNYASDFYGSNLAEFNAVEDSWAYDIFGHHFGQDGAVGLGGDSRRVTVRHTGALDMVTTSTSARSDGYTLQGQENLIQDCQLTASKVHAFETEARQSGPNVFSHCTATLIPSSYSATYDSGGHQRWGGGTLYDAVTIQGMINMQNFGSEGSGHGWGDANSTAWNCNTQDYLIQEPPTAHNWAIGCTGTLDTGSNGQIQNPGANVLPASLYDEQLAERTGAAANDFSIATSPGSTSVTADGSTSATVSTAVTSGPAQTIAISVGGAPAGVTASLGAASVTAGSSATLSVTTTSATTPGTYPLTVTGTAASGSHTTTFTLTVTGAAGCTPAQLIVDPGFENGASYAPWTWSSTLGFNPITNAAGQTPRSGSWMAWFDGNGTKDTDTLSQKVAIPAGCKAMLSYWLHIDSTENTTTAKPDTFTVQLLNSSGTVLTTLATYSNLNKAAGYTQHSFDVSSYAGQTVTLKFTGAETDTSGGTTSFVADDTALQTS